MIHYEIDSRIRCKSSKLLAEPRFVRVNEFTEDSVANFRRQIEAASHTGQPVIPIAIDSPGGEVYSLLAMVDIINSARRHATIATVAEGKAMSCGAVLLTCGDEGFRFVAPSATVLIHDGWTGALGKTGEIQSVADESRRLDADTYAIMDENCGKPRGYFSKLVHERAHADWYLTPKDCKKHNIANHIGIPEMAVSVSVEYAFGVPRVEKPKKRGRK